MITEDILKKVRRIEIISRKSSSELFAGEYHSAFKGRGMEFSEVREYNEGDDIRFIDWNVSSRMGRLYVKQFVEERELTVMLAIDLSASLDFFSHHKSKKEIAAEICALIAFTASLNNDKVGLLIFTRDVELFIPPKKGRTHILRLIREILNFRPEGKGTSIANGLIYLNKVIKKKAIVFLLSDFIADDFTRPLKIASRKHDLIAVKIADPKEQQLPRGGLFILRDPETGEEFIADFASKPTREAFRQDLAQNQDRLARTLKKYSVDFIAVDRPDGYEKSLFEFFLQRRKKFAR